jgi:hypothetical protein
MAGLVPAVHVLALYQRTWMPGTRPGMTETYKYRDGLTSITRQT